MDLRMKSLKYYIKEALISSKNKVNTSRKIKISSHDELYNYIHDQNRQNKEIIDVSNIDISGLLSLRNIFYKTRYKEIRGLNTWDVSNITDFARMFKGCEELEIIDNINKWNFDKALDVEEMFNGCSSLKSNINIKIPKQAKYRNIIDAKSSIGIFIK